MYGKFSGERLAKSAYSFSLKPFESKGKSLVLAVSENLGNKQTNKYTHSPKPFCYRRLICFILEVFIYIPRKKITKIVSLFDTAVYKVIVQVLFTMKIYG